MGDVQVLENSKTTPNAAVITDASTSKKDELVVPSCNDARLKQDTAVLPSSDAMPAQANKTAEASPTTSPDTNKKQLTTDFSDEKIKRIQNFVLLNNMTEAGLYEKYVPSGAIDKLAKDDFGGPALVQTLTKDDARKAVIDTLYSQLKNDVTGKELTAYYDTEYRGNGDKNSSAHRQLAQKIDRVLGNVFPADPGQNTCSTIEKFTWDFGSKVGYLSGKQALIRTLMQNPGKDNSNLETYQKYQNLIKQIVDTDIDRRSIIISNRLGNGISGGLTIEEAALTAVRQKNPGTAVSAEDLYKAATEDNRFATVESRFADNNMGAVRWPILQKTKAIAPTTNSPSITNTTPDKQAELDVAITKAAGQVSDLAKKEQLEFDDIKTIFKTLNYNSEEINNNLVDKIGFTNLVAIRSKLPAYMHKAYDHCLESKKFNPSTIISDVTAFANDTKAFKGKPDDLMNVMTCLLIGRKTDSRFFKQQIEILNNECKKTNNGLDLATLIESAYDQSQILAAHNREKNKLATNTKFPELNQIINIVREKPAS